MNKCGIWLVFALFACAYAQQRAVDQPAFYTGVGGLIRWKEDCAFDVVTEKKVPSINSEQCGGLCLVDQNCNLYNFNDGVCYMTKSPNSNVKAAETKGAVCGYIPTRI